MPNVSTNLDAFRKLSELGRLDEAEAGFLDILAEAPEQVDALIGLGSVFRKRGDRQLALMHFEHAAKADPNHVWARFEVGRGLKDLDRLDQAETALLAILADHPGHAATLTELGHIQRRRGNRTAALDYFLNAIESDPRHVWARSEAANELLELGHPEQAESLYRSVLSDEPTHVPTLMGLGRLHRLRGNQAEALACFESAAKSNPGNSWAYFEMGRILKEGGQLDEAETTFLGVLADNPKHAASMTELGHIKRRRGDRLGALAHFEQASKADPKYVWGRLEAANELRDLGRLEEAEAAFRSLVAENPSHIPTMLGLSRLLWQRGDAAGAITTLERATAAAPKDLGPKVQLANYLRESGRLGEAKAILQGLSGNAPGYASALVGLAQAYREAFVWLEAEAALHKALEIEPNNLAAHIAMGQLARQRGDRDQALSWFESAAAIDRFSTAPSLEIAIEERDQGRFADAEHLIRNVLHDDPVNLQGLMQLGYLERSRGDRRASRAAFLKVFEAHSDHIPALVELAAEERETGHPDASKQWLDLALERDPQHLGALLQSADHALLGENNAEALQLVRRALAAHPNVVWPYVATARVLADDSRVKEALDLLKRARDQFGLHPEIENRRIAIMVSEGELWKARSLLKKVEHFSRHHFWLWAQQVKLAIDMGYYEEAEEALRHSPAKTRNELSRAEALRGQLAGARWELDEAIRCYQRGLEIDSQNAWIHFELARISLLVMDLANARQHLEIYLKLDTSYHLLRGNSLRASQHHLGLLIEEFVLDQELLRKLTEIKKLPLEHQSNSLAALVRENPEITSSAIAYLISLRQRGLLQFRAADAATHPLIPRRIVQFWDSASVPQDVRDLMQTWREVQPEFEYELFNNRTALDFIRQHFQVDVSTAYTRAHGPAQKADLFRLAYLFIKGGIYVDADDRCIGRLDSIIPSTATLALWHETYGTVGNNLIAAVAGHPVIKRALAQATIAINRGDRDSLWLSTGPGVVTRSLTQVLVDALPNNMIVSNSLVVLTAGELQRAIALQCRLNYKKTDQHWSRAMQKSRQRVKKSN